MECDVFEKPLQLYFGIGVVRPVHTVTQAYAWLKNQPPAERSETQTVALNVCLAAIRRQVDAELARAAVAAYAGRIGVLVPDVDDAAIVNAGQLPPARLPA